jgi:hypothetical protein
VHFNAVLVHPFAPRVQVEFQRVAVAARGWTSATVTVSLADTETARMILTCTRNVLWSQCHALNPGFFMARNDKGHFEVQAVSAKGKEEWVRFDIVQQNAISTQEAPTSTVADPSTTASGPVRAEGASFWAGYPNH